MGKSKIEWTDATWNPVTGCTKVSTGCTHCYAERLFPRVYGKEMVRDVSMSGLRGELVERKRKFTDVRLHPDRLDAPLHWKKPRMIFVNSMSDLFHEDVPFEFIDKIFAVMALCPNHTNQILTKRPKRMHEYISTENRWKNSILPEIDKLHSPWGSPCRYLWPLPNVWLGISCENQDTADERIPILLQVPAAVRFLSCEPLLDSIDISNFMWPTCWHWKSGFDTPQDAIKADAYAEKKPQGLVSANRKFVDWVIVGGESGPGYRPMKSEWAESIIEQCQAARVPVFMKQMAGKKEIPEDLQIREYPYGTNNRS